MKIQQICVTSLLFCLTLPLAGCGKNAASEQSATSNAPALTNAPPPKAKAPASASTAATGADALAAFDFTTVPESTATIPPFPYIDYPPTVHEAFQSTRLSPMDEVYVILDKQLHRLEGRLRTISFSNSDADMSALESKRNYENAIKALGGVKVNKVEPGDKAFIAAAGPEPVEEKLRFLQFTMSYDVYLIRKGSARHWIVLMVNDSKTRLLTVEEKAFVQNITYLGADGKTTTVTATGKPALAAQPVDLDAVAVSTAALPPFPYIAYPATVDEAFQRNKDARFDAVSVIVGERLHTVEGRVMTRSFSNTDADMSRMALERNYQAAVAGLGAVKVNQVTPDDPALIAANGDEFDMRKKLRVELNMSYDAYLIRTPQTRVWIVLMFSDSKTSILTVEEKHFTQTVALISADKMRTELADKGRIALYINFDTDKATIRADGKPTVDEITTLLKKDSSLKLAIEGHTDNSGDAKRNKELSQQRADAVVASLLAAGIDNSRLSASGMGDTRPMANNKDEQGRSKNRRVELVKKM